MISPAVEYRIEGSKIASDVVLSGRDRRPGRSRRRQAGTRGPTHDELHRLAAGEPLELVLAGRYRLERLLGCGGMGAVYLAQHLALRRSVAVKILDVDQYDWSWAVGRFLDEARLAARIRHRNIVEIYDFGTTPEGVVYIVMELLSGRDLEAIVRTNRLSWPWTRYVIQQVCAGLGAIHEVGVVHRDLKASNCFFVERNSVVKVLDFGIATTESRGAGGAGIRAVVGTPEYMPPEQIRGAKVDRRADVYAVGVLLCKLITGRTPFIGPTPERVFDQQLERPPPALSELAEVEYPPSLDRVVARALAKEPRRRFQTMGEFVRALDLVDEPSVLRRVLGMPRPQLGPDLRADVPSEDEAPTRRHPRKGEH